jgi:hypothetical protein
VIGPEHRVAGWALAGVLVRPAETAQAGVEAWTRLPDDVVLVLVTADIAAALGTADVATPPGRLRAVLPP